MRQWKKTHFYIYCGQISAAIKAKPDPAMQAFPVTAPANIKTVLPFGFHSCCLLCLFGGGYRSAWFPCTHTKPCYCAFCQGCFRPKHHTRGIFHEVNIFTIAGSLMQDHSKNSTTSGYSYPLRLCQDDAAPHEDASGNFLLLRHQKAFKLCF